MTPYEIEILLQIYTSPGPLGVVDSDLLKNTISKFEESGAIKPSTGNESGWEATDLGRAWVYSLLNVKCPTVKYFDSTGNEIKIGLGE